MVWLQSYPWSIQSFPHLTLRSINYNILLQNLLICHPTTCTDCTSVWNSHLIPNVTLWLEDIVVAYFRRFHGTIDLEHIVRSNYQYWCGVFLVLLVKRKSEITTKLVTTIYRYESQVSSEFSLRFAKIISYKMHIS